MARTVGTSKADWEVSSLLPDSYLFPSVNKKAHQLTIEIDRSVEKTAKVKSWACYHAVNLLSVGTNLLSVVVSAVAVAVDALFRKGIIPQKDKPFTHSCQQLGRSLQGLPILFELRLCCCHPGREE